MKNWLISVIYWTMIGIHVTAWTLVVAFFFVLTAPFQATRGYVGRWFRRGGMGIIVLNPLWRVKITGHVVAPSTHPYVVVANHLSLADIPLLSYLPWEMKWLSKASNFKVPCLGWMMRMAGDIPVRRGDRSSASSAMEKARWYLDRGMSVMIFAEGTRSPDGSMLPFKDGAFRLALESGRPILPVAVCGTREVIRKHSWRLSGSSLLRVEVLPPVSTEGLTLDDLETLKERVREEIRRAVDRLAPECQAFPQHVQPAKVSLHA